LRGAGRGFGWARLAIIFVSFIFLSSNIIGSKAFATLSKKNYKYASLYGQPNGFALFSRLKYPNFSILLVTVVMHDTWPVLTNCPCLNEGNLLPADGTMKDHKNIGDLNILPAKLKLRFKDLPWLLDSTLPQKSRIDFWLQALDRAKCLPCILVNSIPNEGGNSSDDQHQYDLPQDQQMLQQVGPLLFNDDSSKKTTSMWLADNTCIDWLDKQSPGSVIYVSFGSWAAPIQPDKITGFARGLEASGRPFLWALKNHPSWRAGLPDNYEEKVSGRGKIVSWAPQEDVLKHRALGCYIMHCGWNSVLEAARQGVRMICYPVTADHFINCAYIVNMWEIGIELASSDQSDVKDCIERVMEGNEGKHLQQKVNELRETITVGEAMGVAKSNLNLFMDRINNI